MNTHKLLLLLVCFFLSSLISEYQRVESSSIILEHDHHHHHHHDNPHHHSRHHHNGGHGRALVDEYVAPKLFVFGDSYADTGNNNKSTASSWKLPYGITFPGQPAGRYSDGRVMTDFLARFFRTKSPIAYNLRKYAPQRIVYGMNFAFGGTGVFKTLVSDPNMTVQIDFFQDMVRDAVYDAADLNSSVALVSLAGNDYSTYLTNGGSIEGLPAFITEVVTQLTINIKRIHEMGVRKVAVIALEPLGCLPKFTAANSFEQCNETFNAGVRYHNLLLQQALATLNNQTTDLPFATIDLYTAFTTVLNTTTTYPGNTTFASPILEPCCMGINSSYTCGDVDENGEKMYTVCVDPKSTFFWDQFHPTQAAWRAVFSILHDSLKQLYY